MFKKLAIALTVLVATLVVPLSLVHAQDYSTTSSNDYQYTDSTNSLYSTTGGQISEEDAAAAMLSLLFGGTFLVIGLISALVGYVYAGLTVMTIAKKLNIENAWLAWVPIANLYILAKCADLNPWLMLLFFVPIANVVFAVYVFMKISERRGYSQYLGLLMLVPVANLVLLGILAWGKSPSDK